MKAFMWTRSHFGKCLSAILDDYSTTAPSRKLFFQAVHVAYRYALGQPGEITNNTNIVFPIHSVLPTRHTAQFAEDFPSAKYVLMVRQPINTFTSTVRILSLLGDDLLFRHASLYPALFGGVATAPLVEANSRAIKLEDLHRSPRETMETLCQWLQLAWDESLMSSTFNKRSGGAIAAALSNQWLLQ